jgi:hypothetical protein
VTKMVDRQEAIKAANALKRYCKSINANCNGCVFYVKSDVNFLNGCKLNGRLPENWDLKR